MENGDKETGHGIGACMQPSKSKPEPWSRKRVETLDTRGAAGSLAIPSDADRADMAGVASTETSHLAEADVVFTVGAYPVVQHAGGSAGAATVVAFVVGHGGHAHASFLTPNVWFAQVDDFPGGPSTMFVMRPTREPTWPCRVMDTDYVLIGDNRLVIMPADVFDSLLRSGPASGACISGAKSNSTGAMA